MRFVIVATLLFLNGCATTMPSVERLKPAPVGQVVELPKASSSTPAKIRIVRDEGFASSISLMHLTINGKRLAALNPGEFIDFTIDPGQHILTVSPTEVFFGSVPTKKLDALWLSGKSYLYRVGIDPAMQLDMYRVPD